MAAGEALARAQAAARNLEAALGDDVAAVLLVGSAVLDDWRPAGSDVDLLVVTRRDLSGSERTACRRAMGRGVDSQFASYADILTAPRTLDLAIALKTFAQSGVVVSGEAPSPPAVDRMVLDRLLIANLETYWSRWNRDVRRPLGPRWWMMFGSWAPAWCLLGVARIAHTLETGEVVSKTAAGRWASVRWPELEGPIGEAIRLRTKEGPARFRSRLARRTAVVAAMDRMLSDLSAAGSRYRARDS